MARDSAQPARMPVRALLHALSPRDGVVSYAAASRCDSCQSDRSSRCSTQLTQVVSLGDSRQQRLGVTRSGFRPSRQDQANTPDRGQPRVDLSVENPQLTIERNPRLTSRRHALTLGGLVGLRADLAFGLDISTPSTRRVLTTVRALVSS